MMFIKELPHVIFNNTEFPSARDEWMQQCAIHNWNKRYNVQKLKHLWNNEIAVMHLLTEQSLLPQLYFAIQPHQRKCNKKARSKMLRLIASNEVCKELSEQILSSSDNQTYYEKCYRLTSFMEYCSKRTDDLDALSRFNYEAAVSLLETIEDISNDTLNERHLKLLRIKRKAHLQLMDTLDTTWGAINKMRKLAFIYLTASLRIKSTYIPPHTIEQKRFYYYFSVVSIVKLFGVEDPPYSEIGALYNNTQDDCDEDAD